MTNTPLIFPNINPIAVSLGPLEIHWYGLMYLFGFMLAYGLARFRSKKLHLGWTAEDISDLIFYGAIGVVLGGRLGYLLFYNTMAFFKSPWMIIKVWEGGMSFHGGLIGVILGLLYFSHKKKRALLDVMDFTAPLVPLGLALGRMGNFINGELWGRTTSVAWGMIFPEAGPEPRHPSQLYELGLEGIFLFILMLVYARKTRPQGAVSGLFLMGYAVCRITIEFFREPDVQLGFLAFDWLTMGQLLSIPMFIVGLILWCKAPPLDKTHHAHLP
ncbi:MAG: prolipoprotein diacylglyceryl transferase [Legionellaceae bacterium]